MLIHSNLQLHTTKVQSHKFSHTFEILASIDTRATRMYDYMYIFTTEENKGLGLVLLFYNLAILCIFTFLEASFVFQEIQSMYQPFIGSINRRVTSYDRCVTCKSFCSTHVSSLSHDKMATKIFLPLPFKKLCITMLRTRRQFIGSSTC